MRALLRGPLLAMLACVACKGEAEHEEEKPRSKPKSQAAPVVESASAEATTKPAESTGPRYLRPDRKGVLVDAFRFPSVPASMVEQEVSEVSTRSDAAGVLRRFGMTALEGHAGQVWIAKASLVDRLARERVLVVSFRGDANSDGVRDEDGWIVFLGSTHDDRVLKIGSARITAKTTADEEVEVDAQELHTADADDVVANFSTCAKPGQKACHTLRAWTMQRGYPELVVDVTGDSKPVIAGSSAPHEVVVDGRVLKFDSQAFAYK
ncbi:MAG: hypothetical protein ACXVEE_28285 [Polyangiales bacterium]